MKTSLLWILCFLFFSGCSKKDEKNELSDLNIYIQSQQKIDSIFISNIGQDREFLFLPHQDTMRVNFKDSINDLYNIWIFSEGKQYSAGNKYQFWLRGDHIEVKGSFDKGFHLDTLIGSDIYYPSMDFQKEYTNLYRQKRPAAEIDEYLLTYTKNNLNNILSLQSANYYMFRNKNDQQKLKTLQKIIEPHEKLFKNHNVLNVHASLDKLLTVNAIDIAKYSFVDTYGKEASITFESNKTYLLDLWFVKCTPCIQDHQKFKEHTTLLSNHNVELIGLSIDDNQEEWTDFLSEKAYPWKNYRQKSYEGSLREELLVEVFPTYFLVEGNGALIRTFNAFDDIKDYFEETP